MSSRVSINYLQAVKALPFPPPRSALHCESGSSASLIFLSPVREGAEKQVVRTTLFISLCYCSPATLKIHMRGSFNDWFWIVLMTKHHQTEYRAEPGQLTGFKLKRFLSVVMARP